MATASDLRYPIGRFEFEPVGSESRIDAWIEAIAGLPARLRSAVTDLSEEQWETPYRPGGWTVRQVVHHLPDSHLNAYIRFKLALTESDPAIKPYDEAKWAELPDSRLVAPDVSLSLLDALHTRWSGLLRAMKPEDFGRRFEHPEHKRFFTLEEALAMYEWHGRHHLGHITALAEREGW
jgi:uncharacterized damage-inducible protein DinB